MQEFVIPFTREDLKSLQVGQELLVSGKLYTARDRAHKMIVNLINHGRKLPFSLKDKVIYYCGPTFRKRALGACGPTTASRMDAYLLPLFQQGLSATIGKGKRARSVSQLCRKYHTVYFLTYGGAAAYLSQFVKEYRILAFEELGAEAVYEFTVEKFPLIVGIDIYGNDLYRRLEE